MALVRFTRKNVNALLSKGCCSTRTLCHPFLCNNLTVTFIGHYFYTIFPGML